MVYIAKSLVKMGRFDHTIRIVLAIHHILKVVVERLHPHMLHLLLWRCRGRRDLCLACEIVKHR
jgi:hypothetical protein